MTLENFNYRTNPLFLRNEFDSDEPWSMPIIPKANLSLDSNLRLIGFDKVKNSKDNHYKRMVHFFLYDYQFESIWDNPGKYIDALKQYKAVLSPDFSMYIEMNPIMQLYNTFRNRWVGAFLASKGIKVVPTVNWGLENSFGFCFNGIEKGSTVAVSTYMVSEHGNHCDQKDFFMKGYNEMLNRIEPELVICYHEPFPEMTGNILYVNYSLSSWQHYEDDECKSITQNSSTIIIKNSCGYICSDRVKGIGSAFGGNWKPKKLQDERFLGKPNSIKTYITPKGEKYETKIGENGLAIKERHHTTHNKEHTGHTNPHDHNIDWTNGFPVLGKPINYPDKVIPEFKSLERGNIMNICGNTNDLKFESISDFRHSLVYGREIEFEWNGMSYGIFREEDNDKEYALYKVVKGDTFKNDDKILFKSPDEVLDYVIDEMPLRKLITDVIVLNRNV